MALCCICVDPIVRCCFNRQCVCIDREEGEGLCGCDSIVIVWCVYLCVDQGTEACVIQALSTDPLVWHVQSNALTLTAGRRLVPDPESRRRKCCETQSRRHSVARRLTRRRALPRVSMPCLRCVYVYVCVFVCWGNGVCVGVCVFGGEGGVCVRECMPHVQQQWLLPLIGPHGGQELLAQLLHPVLVQRRFQRFTALLLRPVLWCDV